MGKVCLFLTDLFRGIRVLELRLDRVLLPKQLTDLVILIFDFDHVFIGEGTEQRLVSLLIDHGYVPLQVFQLALPPLNHNLVSILEPTSPPDRIFRLQHQHLDLILLVQRDTHVSFCFQAVKCLLAMLQLNFDLEEVLHAIRLFSVECLE